MALSRLYQLRFLRQRHLIFIIFSRSATYTQFCTISAPLETHESILGIFRENVLAICLKHSKSLRYGVREKCYIGMDAKICENEGASASEVAKSRSLELVDMGRDAAGRPLRY